MNSVYKHFIIKYMFVILCTFTKMQQYVLSSAVLDISILLHLIVRHLCNIIHPFSSALLLLVLIMLCNIHVHPLIYLVVYLLNSTSTLYFTFLHKFQYIVLPLRYQQTYYTYEFCLSTLYY